MFMMSKNTELNDYFSEFSKLFSGEIVLDEDFMYNFALNVAGIQGVANEIIDYSDVPEKYEEVDLYYSESMEYYIEAMNDVVLAVGSDFEDDHMLNAMENLELGGDYLSEATRLTKELKDKQ